MEGHVISPNKSFDENLTAILARRRQRDISSLNTVVDEERTDDIATAEQTVNDSLADSHNLNIFSDEQDNISLRSSRSKSSELASTSPVDDSPNVASSQDDDNRDLSMPSENYETNRHSSKPPYEHADNVDSSEQTTNNAVRVGTHGSSPRKYYQSNIQQLQNQLSRGFQFSKGHLETYARKCTDQRQSQFRLSQPADVQLFGQETATFSPDQAINSKPLRPLQSTGYWSFGSKGFEEETIKNRNRELNAFMEPILERQLTMMNKLLTGSRLKLRDPWYNAGDDRDNKFYTIRMRLTADLKYLVWSDIADFSTHSKSHIRGVVSIDHIQNIELQADSTMMNIGLSVYPCIESKRQADHEYLREEWPENNGDPVLRLAFADELQLNDWICGLSYMKELRKIAQTS